MPAILASRAFGASAYYSLFPFLLVLLTGRFGLGLWGSGVVVALMLLASRLLAVPAGRLIDRHGAGPFILGSNLASMGAVLGLILIPPDATAAVILLLLLRGAMASGQGVAYQVLMHQRSDRGALVRSYANLGIAANLGVIIGPLAASYAGPIQVAPLLLPLLFHGLSAALALGIGGGRRPLAEQEAEPVHQANPNAAGGLSRPFLIAYFVQWVLLQQIILSLAYFCTRVMGNDNLGGVFFALQGALIIPTLYVAGRHLSRVGEDRRVSIFILGCLVLAASYLAFGALAPALPLYSIVLFAIILTAAEALSVPIGDAYIASSGRTGALGSTFSLVALLQSAGMAAGSLLGAGLIASLEGAGALAWFWQTCGAVGLVFFIPAGIVALRARPAAAPASLA
ncbi:MAG TPA: MFS transporter [Allosphingosinicella sp.]|nr:MFS transporter [Allosphingosinicella sp.]